jgi:hypothetical protein
MKALHTIAVAALLVLMAAPVLAADNDFKARVSDGAGGSAEAVFGAKDLTTYIVPKQSLVDQDGNEVLGQKDEAKSTATDTTSISIMQVLKQVSASVQAIATSVAGTLTVGTHAVTVASGGVASGAIASGALASGAYASGAIGSGAVASGAYASGAIGSGAIASGALASGSIASGALASGSMAASSCADGCSVTLGLKADAKSTATDTTSISLMSVAKQISASVQAIASALVDTTIGSAPPTTANYIAGNGSGATGGLIAGVKTCDLHTFYTGSDNGSKTLVAGVASRKIYICGFILGTSTTAATLTLYKGTDADCATSGAAIGPPYALVANDRVGAVSTFWTGFVTATNADYVCVNSGTAVPHTAEIWYTIQ